MTNVSQVLRGRNLFTLAQACYRDERDDQISAALLDNISAAEKNFFKPRE
jgi:hypothetical protein